MILERQIRAWMVRHVAEHVDACGEVDCTGLAEAWDRAEADGGATLDEHHPAWDIAVDVGDAYERLVRR